MSAGESFPRRLRIIGAAAGLLLLGASGAAAGDALPAPSVYQREAAMSRDDLIARWAPFIGEASRRFGVPVTWIRAVITAESGGRTMLVEGVPITSPKGAMGLMQLMPDSWQAMRSACALGNDPYDPHDNILAGTALLRDLYAQYGYPGLFAAYNDGPGMVDARRQAGQLLPDETIAYVLKIARILRQHGPRDLSIDPKHVDPGDESDAPADNTPPMPVEYDDDEDSGVD